MVCAEKARLQDVFAAAIIHHSKTVKALHSAMGASFNQALKDAAVARQEAETARLTVEDHRAIHGC
jgi:hypothetical protein